MKLLITLSLLHFCVSSFAQSNLNSPILTWGAGLDGSPLQKTAIYSDTDNGLLFEAPRDAFDNRLNISFKWRGPGVTPPLFIQGSSLNVGIGTTLPNFKLDIEGHGVRIRNSSTAANSYTTLRIQGPDYSEGLEIDVFGNNNITSSLNWSYGGGAGSAAIINVNSKPLVFGTSNQGRMIIDAEGNVGIGTSNPNQKLTVNGTIYSREVKVDLSVPGPDYVFEPDYNLPTLTEIETYIKANKHLPEVPSAKEMETNGINLSEMNMLLLKKVEELTLHLIEVQKNNTDQQKQLTKQSKEIEFLKSKIK